jgi:hypothetical protein
MILPEAVQDELLDLWLAYDFWYDHDKNVAG